MPARPSEHAEARGLAGRDVGAQAVQGRRRAAPPGAAAARGAKRAAGRGRASARRRRRRPPRRAPAQKAYSMASGHHRGSRARAPTRCATPGLRPSGRSRTSAKRPCAVIQSARSDRDRIVAPAARNSAAPRRVSRSTPKAPMRAEEAVALQHRGIDRRVALVAGQEVVGAPEHVDDRVPPGRMVGIDDRPGRREAGPASPQRATRRAFMWRLKKRAEDPHHDPVHEGASGARPASPPVGMRRRFALSGLRVKTPSAESRS